MRIQDLEVQYQGENPIHFPDFECHSDRPLLVLGSSGSGKSSLLHMIAGLIKPRKGKIWIDDTEITGLSQSEMDVFRRKKIGVALQKSVFIHSLTVLENLMYFQYFSHAKQNESECMDWLTKLGLENKADQKAFTLSQGEQQRVNFIRALMKKPSLLLADEPSSSLEDENAIMVARLLLHQADQIGTTLIVVTHDHRLSSMFSNSMTLV